MFRANNACSIIVGSCRHGHSKASPCVNKGVQCTEALISTFVAGSEIQDLALPLYETLCNQILYAINLFMCSRIIKKITLVCFGLLCVGAALDRKSWTPTPFFPFGTARAPKRRACSPRVPSLFFWRLWIRPSSVFLGPRQQQQRHPRSLSSPPATPGFGRIRPRHPFGIPRVRIRGFVHSLRHANQQQQRHL